MKKKNIFFWFFLFILLTTFYFDFNKTKLAETFEIKKIEIQGVENADINLLNLNFTIIFTTKFFNCVSFIIHNIFTIMLFHSFVIIVVM